MYFPSAVLERALVNKCSLNALFSISVALNSLQVGGPLRILNSFFFRSMHLSSLCRDKQLDSEYRLQVLAQ
jgi:hypothetical protein